MKSRKTKCWISFGSALLASLFLAGCQTTAPIKTILPPRVESVQPSFDENVQDSGIKDFIEGKGFEISKSALTRFNALIFLYGKSNVPPLEANYGVTNEEGKIYLSMEAMVQFVVMSDKFRNGVKP